MRIAAASLFLMMAATAAGAGEQPAFLGLPAYPATESVKYEGHMTTNDVPLDAVVATTGDDIEKVMQFYSDYILAHAPNGVQRRTGPGAGYIGYFDPATRSMRLVTVLSLPNGKTMLVYSNMNPKPLLEQPGRIPDDLPAPEGATGVIATEEREGRGRHRSVSFSLAQVPDAAREAVIAAGRERGWTPAPAQRLHPEQTMLVRGGARCMVKVSAETADAAEEPGADRTSSRITMLIIEPELEEH